MTCAGRVLIVFCAVAALLLAGAASADPLSPALLEAMEAARMGRATEWQKAMLFANNDAINLARLNGFVTDAHYQAAQREYAILNEGFARRAAVEAGADLTPQKRKSILFSPGTDSDFIIQTTSNDPVGQIHDVQDRYNALVNEHLRKSAADAGVTIHAERADWHNRLDVDFMADPRRVTEDQFRQISELNNDAYRRRRAAEYERLSRMADPQIVEPRMFQEYAQEMEDFIGKKGKLLEELRRNPQRLTDPNVRAEFHRLMAQRQKYIERIEAANVALRRQEGLPLPDLPEATWEMRYNANGEAELIHRSSESLAARGARRGPAGFRTTAVADALSDHSVQRAVSDLSESMAEAAAKNPARWKSAASEIAEIAGALPPAEKGRLIERARLRAGDDFARDLAERMRRGPEGDAAAGAISNALHVSDDIRDMGRLRRGFHQAAGQARRALDKIGGAAGALEIAMAASDMRSYFDAIDNALDPSITDDEADRFFERAQEIAHSMILNGTMGALFERAPIAGAAYMAWTVGYTGTRYLLTSTETGRQIDRHVFEYFDRHLQAYESAVDELTERLGGESSRMAREDQIRELEARYTRAIAEGRIRIREGATGADVLQAIRSGDVWALDDLLVSTAGENADKGLGETYMAWLTDVSDCASSPRVWINAGTAESFRAPTPCRDVTWGGKSTKPAVKTELFGGRTFESFDEVANALLVEIGGAIVRKRAPLAFPKVYYMAGDKHVGFEIMSHAAFAPIKEQADQRADASVAGAGSETERDAPPPRFVRESRRGAANTGSKRAGDDEIPQNGEPPRFIRESDIDENPLAGANPWSHPLVQQRIDEWLRTSHPKMPSLMRETDRRQWRWSDWGQPYAPPAVMLTDKPDTHGKSRYQYLFEMADKLESSEYGTLRQFIETGAAPTTNPGSGADNSGAVVAAGSGTTGDGASAPALRTGADVEMTAAPFTARTALGRPWRLEDQRGKTVVLVTFDPLVPQRGAEVQRLAQSFPVSGVELFHVMVQEPHWSAGLPEDHILLPEGDMFAQTYRPARQLSVWVISKNGEVAFRGDYDGGRAPPWRDWIPALRRAAPNVAWTRPLTLDKKK